MSSIVIITVNYSDQEDWNTYMYTVYIYVSCIYMYIIIRIHFIAGYSSLVSEPKIEGET